MGLLENVRKGRAVDRSDDENLGALRDHVFDLRKLVRNVVVCILQVGLVTGGLKLLDDVVAVVDPASLSLRRHC
jgi:hypothetical protein